MMGEGKLIKWAQWGSMVTIRCTVCRATFLTKNIGSEHSVEGMVGVMYRNMHVISVDAYECDAAGHTLEDCRILREDNLGILEKEEGQ